ncbi:MAG TPA: ankyrin repeat domain-containing protein [Thermoplasmata archaeon]
MPWKRTDRKKEPETGASREQYTRLRQNWLSGEAASLAPPDVGPIDVVAVMIEFGSAAGTATFVAANDGTASMYASSGGGIIGMGFHPSVAAASLALIGCAQGFLEVLPKVAQFPLPQQQHVAFRIVTRTGVHSAEFAEAAIRDDSPISPFYLAGQDLVTNMRVLDERRKKGGIGSDVLRVHLLADGGIFLLTPYNREPTCLTQKQLGKVLEIAKAHGDRLEVSVEPEAQKLHRSVLQVIESSGFAGAPSGGPIDAGFTIGSKTLHYAVDAARLDLAQDLIQRGADLEAKDERGYSALILAAFKGRTAVLRTLLEGGADAKAQDRHGNGALMFAAQWGDLEAAKLLLAAGADIGARGQNGYTALKIAKLCSQLEVARFLAARGATD